MKSSKGWVGMIGGVSLLVLGSFGLTVKTAYAAPDPSLVDGNPGDASLTVYPSGVSLNANGDCFDNSDTTDTDTVQYALFVVAPNGTVTLMSHQRGETDNTAFCLPGGLFIGQPLTLEGDGETRTANVNSGGISETVTAPATTLVDDGTVATRFTSIFLGSPANIRNLSIELGGGVFTTGLQSDDAVYIEGNFFLSRFSTFGSLNFGQNNDYPLYIRNNYMVYEEDGVVLPAGNGVLMILASFDPGPTSEDTPGNVHPVYIQNNTFVGSTETDFGFNIRIGNSGAGIDNVTFTNNNLKGTAGVSIELSPYTRNILVANNDLSGLTAHIPLSISGANHIVTNNVTGHLRTQPGVLVPPAPMVLLNINWHPCFLPACLSESIKCDEAGYPGTPCWRTENNLFAGNDFRNSDPDVVPGWETCPDSGQPSGQGSIYAIEFEDFVAPSPFAVSGAGLRNNKIVVGGKFPKGADPELQVCAVKADERNTKVVGVPN